MKEVNKKQQVKKEEQAQSKKVVKEVSQEKAVPKQKTPQEEDAYLRAINSANYFIDGHLDK
jgi:hypothetical protein